MENYSVYLAKIRSALKYLPSGQKHGNYLDLATIEHISSKDELLNSEPPQSGLADFQEIIIKEISECHLDKVKIGINELLKHLLAHISKENELFLVNSYLCRLRMIFKRCLLPDFPFSEEIWNYVCECLRTAGSFMVENDLFHGANEIIDSLAQMGRIAASRNLPTASTQSSLRIIENIAHAKNQHQLASKAKNARFNMES